MEIVLIGVGVLVALLYLYLSAIATICIWLDPELEPFQRYGQSIVVWLFPLVGASFILHLVNDHSPDVIARFYIPWPFSNLVSGKKLRTSDNNIDQEEIPGLHSGRGIGGSNIVGGSD